MSKKSLTQRAAEAIKNGAASSELVALQTEIVARIQEVVREISAKDGEIDAAMGGGDLDALRAARQTEADLRDEDKVLHRQQADLAAAISAEKGREAVRESEQHRENLTKALEQAENAQAMLKESKRMAQRVHLAREHAKKVGQSLVFDANTIRALAAAIHPPGNDRKQLMINLGIHEAMKAA